MSTSKTYWIAIPGSNEPPMGPLGLDEIATKVRAGSIPREATACEVGLADWIPVEKIVPKRPREPRKKKARVEEEVVSDRSAIESEYGNLATVSDSTVSYGTVIKGLAFAVMLSGGLVVFALEGMWKSLGILPFVLGVVMHVMGTMVAAAGEAMRALKDIAVNTRILADAAERDDG